MNEQYYRKNLVEVEIETFLQILIKYKQPFLQNSTLMIMHFLKFFTGNDRQQIFLKNLLQATLKIFSAYVRYQVLLDACFMVLKIQKKNFGMVKTSTLLDEKSKQEALHFLQSQYPDLHFVQFIHRSKLIQGFQWYYHGMRTEISRQRLIQDVRRLI